MPCPGKAGGALRSRRVICGMLLRFPRWDSSPGVFQQTRGCCSREDGAVGASRKPSAAVLILGGRRSCSNVPER